MEQKGSNCPRSDSPDRFSAGRPAATPIVTDAVLTVESEICVSRTVFVHNIAVISGTLICIVYHH